MAAILSQYEVFEQEQEKYASVATTLNNRTAQKFSNRPIAIVRSVGSIAQTSAKNVDTGVESYYLLPRPINFSSVSLPPQPYEIRTIEDQSYELRLDDIAVHELTRSITRRDVDVVQSLSNLKRKKFLPSANSLVTSLPHSQCFKTSTDWELEEDEPFWRGVFALPSSAEVLFSERIEVEVDKLPSWEPHIVIDNYRLEEDE
ncbi:hypothetical protein VB712_06440 [Spirulina sp. CCNP1310]|uniref:hypothetical protein n=1 Tax=Spirulina sp. CCNP1310 TaxID=3110249 RepID=UPI002B21ABB0|nr:hypothetical protein [Spirulina sp. CCNP1310]MEA5418860.1 hypothetical protein [Spirulina sp. CCNP1310]